MPYIEIKKYRVTAESRVANQTLSVVLTSRQLKNWKKHVDNLVRLIGNTDVVFWLKSVEEIRREYDY